MKKTISIVLLIAMLLSFSTTSLAVEGYQLDNPDSLIYDEELAQHYLDIAASKNMSQHSRLNVYLDVPLQLQTDSRWTNDTMQTAELSIGEYGCALTSTSMIANYYDRPYTPATLNVALGNNACPLQYGSAAQCMGKTAGVKISSNYPSVSTCKDLIIGAIDDGEPVLIRMTYGTDGSHYVVGYGYATGTSPTIFIRDPMGDWSTLESYQSRGYQVHWLMVYR